MIFYFSGTGNSAWVARQLAEGQNEELLSIAMEIDRNKAYKLKEGEKVGFVFPVYAWGPPKIVLRFIHQLKLDKPGSFSLSVLAEMIQAGLHKFFLLPLPGKVGNVLPAIRLLCRIRMFLCPVLM